MSEISTGEYQRIAIKKLVCDQCNKDINLDNSIRYDYEWSDGFDFYGDKADFCSIGCFHTWIGSSLEKDYTIFPNDGTVKIYGNGDIIKSLLKY